jgi:uncharacterized membrane protein
MLLLCALLLGVVAGLRSMLAPTIVSWFARCGVLAVANTPLAFMGFQFTPVILSVLAVGELIVDKLPNTPSRKAPTGFIARIVTGGLSGATIGAAGHSLVVGLILGIIGAVAGTYGGAAIRGKLAAAFGRDLPAALLEDVVGIAIGVFSLMAVK